MATNLTDKPVDKGKVPPRTLRPAGGGPADVGANLRQRRLAQGLSLEALAGLSGVSRAMLGQIETGKSTPTVTLIWKVATALGVPVSALIEKPRSSAFVVLPRANARVIAASGGGFTLRAFAASGIEQRAEFYEMRVASGHRETISPYPPGLRATLALAAGTLEVGLEAQPAARIEAGDAILFEADVAHTYCNPGVLTAIAYLVIAPARNGNGALLP